MTPLSTRERVLYAFGAIAFGVKDCGFSYWLLIFYNQACGLSSERASFALFIALLFDAVADVGIGYFSDHLRSHWGRRHPLMYASALPVALFNAALWSPPVFAAGEGGLFTYLVVTAILVRFAISLNEIPQIALVAELSSSYDERTSLLSLRFFFGWLGGLSMTVLLQSLLLHPSSQGARDAFFDREGFRRFGFIGSAVMACAILTSAAGIHHRIPQLRRNELPSSGAQGTRARGSILAATRHMARSMALTLRNRSLGSILGASLLFGMSSG